MQAKKAYITELKLQWLLHWLGAWCLVCFWGQSSVKIVWWTAMKGGDVKEWHSRNQLLNANKSDLQSWEIKSRLNLGNICYLQFRMLPSHLLAKNANKQNYSFTCCFIRVWNLVSHYEGRTQTGCLRTWCKGKYLDLRRNKITGGWRKVHNEELHNLYSSPNSVRVIKSRKIRWTKHVPHMRDGK